MKAGSGVATLSGATNLGGAVSVGGGTLALAGTIGAATIAAGDIRVIVNALGFVCSILMLRNLKANDPQPQPKTFRWRRLALCGARRLRRESLTKTPA